MQINNTTTHDITEMLDASVADYDHDCLLVEVKYCPTGSKRCVSGTYYRLSPSSPEGKVIRLRINRTNKYPIKLPFRTSDYFKKTDSHGREVTYQRIRTEKITCPEHLLLAVFLHEFSHYLDHIEGRNGRYKQTKADRFSLERLTKLGILHSVI